MAGNFLKYGAAEASFGSKNASDIPVDAHQLIALCAPRPTFISYGIPEKGDANWLDQQGSYMATVAAGPVFRLLGARDIGVAEDYRVAKMPPVQHGPARRRAGVAPARRRARGPLEHELLHRLGEPAAPSHAAPGSRGPAADARRPELAPRPPAAPGQGEERAASTSTSWAIRSRAAGAPSTTRTSWPIGRRRFHGWNAGNFGWGADRTENILWRLENGELDGVNPKVIVILAGTNNVGKEPGDEAKVADITRGLKAIVDTCRKKAPAATIVLTAIFPRNDDPAVMPTIDRINANLAKMADGKSIRFLDVNARLADRERRPVRGDDGRRAAPEPEGLRGLGRGLEADPHRAARARRPPPTTLPRPPAIPARLPGPARKIPPGDKMAPPSYRFGDAPCRLTSSVVATISM